MASQVPDDLITKLAAETGLSADDVRHVAEHAVLFVDTLKSTGAVREEGLIRVWACIRCVFSIGPIRKIFWCVVCSLLSRH